MIKHPISVAGVLLALFAAAGTGLVAFTHTQTKARIESNERQALLNSLSSLVPADSIDNDIVTDTRRLNEPDALGGTAVQVYLGRKAGRPVAAVFNAIAPDGYSGEINLLVAIKEEGTLGGVRVVSHKETPGLGDKVEIKRSNWIRSFDNKGLSNPSLPMWKVKRDGGSFDQFTGATITPRAIVKAVKKTLLYFEKHGESLFTNEPEATSNE